MILKAQFAQLSLKLWKRNQQNANDCFPPFGKFIKFCLNVIFIHMLEAGAIQGIGLKRFSNLNDVWGMLSVFC